FGDRLGGEATFVPVHILRRSRCSIFISVAGMVARPIGPTRVGRQVVCVYSVRRDSLSSGCGNTADTAGQLDVPPSAAQQTSYFQPMAHCLPKFLTMWARVGPAKAISASQTWARRVLDGQPS